jgi:hypothetical protein
MNICILTDDQKKTLEKRNYTASERGELAIIANANMALIKTMYAVFTDVQGEADKDQLAGLANLLLWLAEPLYQFMEYGG